jgi:UPF0042 nucleotide-binding protein
MRFVIVTGMSGAGKSQALKIFEDFGYYCVDNLPLELLVSFAKLLGSGKAGMEQVALGIDVRNGESFARLLHVLESEDFQHVPYEILYLDASDECLIKRFKETRRSHPLEAQQGSLEAGIREERRLLACLRGQAAYVIDTSFLLTRDLRRELNSIFIQDQEFKNLNITILSFGFKYGIPIDADLVFDVRFLPNPFYIEDLKPLSGNDAAVSDYVLSFDVTKTFLAKLTDMIEFLIPNYILEGKNQLVIAIGCTGGRHRSVTIANALYNALSGKGYGLKVEHKEL